MADVPPGDLLATTSSSGIASKSSALRSRLRLYIVIWAKLSASGPVIGKDRFCIGKCHAGDRHVCNVNNTALFVQQLLRSPDPFPETILERRILLSRLDVLGNRDSDDL